MKVILGKPKGDIVPIKKWEHIYFKIRGYYEFEEEKHDWMDKFFMELFGYLDRAFLPINRWANRRKAKEYIRIDGHDVWSMHNTLALIVHPMLLKLKELKHGSPMVDDEDVPEHLFIHDRWEWVLDEMIWAFKQHTDWDDGKEYYHNRDQLGMEFEKSDIGKGYSELKFNHQKDPNKPAYWVDYDGLKAHEARKANGLRLFAKYYGGLWD